MYGRVFKYLHWRILSVVPCHVQPKSLSQVINPYTRRNAIRPLGKLC